MAGRGIVKKRTSRSSRAGLVLPISRVEKHLRKRRLTSRTSQGAPVYLTGAMEYVIETCLTRIVDAMMSDGRQRIMPKHVHQALARDPELSKLVKSVTMSGTGR